MAGGYPVKIFGYQLKVQYLCKYCSLVLRDPVQIGCGHLFCRSCFEFHVRSGERCQQCEREYEYSPIDQVYPDNAVKREIHNLPVVCSNSGCDWTGRFKELEFGESFQTRFILCPANCGFRVDRANADRHFDRAPLPKHILHLIDQIQSLRREVYALQLFLAISFFFFFCFIYI